MKTIFHGGVVGALDKGAHATFTKFVPGYDTGMHTHTNDVWIAVIKGAYSVGCLHDLAN
jgi:hypothetical protein